MKGKEVCIMTLRDIVPFGRKTRPVRYGGYHPLSLFRKDMDDLFDSFFRGFEIEPYFGESPGAFSPHVDINENDREIKVTAELPGMDNSDIDVSVNKDSLTIKGEKKEEKEDKGKDYYHVERSFGSFSRTIPLPEEVETEKAEAHFKKGVLKIKIPKSKKAIEEKKKINIKVR
jgi:HSP20 family protein